MTNCWTEAVREELFIWYFSAPKMEVQKCSKSKNLQGTGKKIAFWSPWKIPPLVWIITSSLYCVCFSFCFIQIYLLLVFVWFNNVASRCILKRIIYATSKQNPLCRTFLLFSSYQDYVCPLVQKLMLQGSVPLPFNRVGTSCSLHTPSIWPFCLSWAGSSLTGRLYPQHLESISGSVPLRPPHLYLDERFIIRAS